MLLVIKSSSNIKLFSMGIPDSFTVIDSHVLCSLIHANICLDILSEMIRFHLSEFISM